MNVIITNKWNDIYEENKRLDNIFNSKYHDDIYRKNCLEILVELSEFINETKVFKYWSIKSPNKEKVYEEYADVITMCLYFFNELNLNLDYCYQHIESIDVIDIINYLYEKMSLLMYHSNKDLIKDIFGNILYLGKLLNLDEEEILLAINKKQKIIRERLNSDY